MLETFCAAYRKKDVNMATDVGMTVVEKNGEIQHVSVYQIEHGDDVTYWPDENKQA